MEDGGPGAIRTPDPQIRRRFLSLVSNILFSKTDQKEVEYIQGLIDALQTEKELNQQENLTEDYTDKEANAIFVGGVIGQVLALGTPEAMWELVPVFMRRLSVVDRSQLAFIALHSLDPDMALETSQAALDRGAGWPIPPLFSFSDQAAFWADMAHPTEIEAYALASFKRMATDRQRAFLKFLSEAH